MKLPEILTRDRHLENKREGRCPPGPPFPMSLQMDKIPNWTKSRFGQNPELGKIQNGQNPELNKISDWTKSQTGKTPNGQNPESNQLQRSKKSGLIVYSLLAYKQ